VPSDQEPEAADAPANAHHQIADLLGGPRPGRVRGDAEQVHAPRADLHGNQNVETAQQHGVQMEEVDRQQSFRLCA